MHPFADKPNQNFITVEPLTLNLEPISLARIFHEHF